MDVRILPFEDEDYALAAKWLANPAVNRWLYAEWRGRMIDERLVAIAANNPKNRLFMVHADGVRAGIMAIGEINKLDANAIVWCLMDPDQQSRGIATVAMGLLVEHGFVELGLHSITCSIIEGNEGSRRMLERNGFVESGRLRAAFRVDGTFRDRILYHVVAPEALTAAGQGSSEPVAA